MILQADIVQTGSAIGELAPTGLLGVVVIALALSLRHLYNENVKLNAEAKNDAKEVIKTLTSLDSTMKEWRKDQYENTKELTGVVDKGVQRVLDQLKP